MKQKHFMHSLRKWNRLLLIAAAVCITACGCTNHEKKAAYQISAVKGTRDSKAVCLIPDASAKSVFSDATYSLDYSNASEGYIMAKYTGKSQRAKLQLTLPDGTVYTYNLNQNYEAFPLTSDSGTYCFGIYENISGNEYSTLAFEKTDVQIVNRYGAYLYPNQYVSFTKSSQTIILGEKLAYSANSDLEVVSNVYNYIIDTVSYDYQEAKTIKSGYLPNIDATLDSKKGICLDYAAVMASILRSQQIPTHLEVGYAGTAYHAWISTYIKDIGWVNGIIKFDGKNWELMDPTFGSTTGAEKLKKYIGDGSNYKVKYIY
jgi:hypothetical protein